MSKLLIYLVLLLVGLASCQSSWYDYYTEGGRNSGLVADHADYFRLNDKPLRIVSGAIHYFRVHPVYWQDRLRKLRAVGCNTVETYVPWNLHEPQQHVFDFGDGNNDMSPFLDLRKFVELARQEDLFVIIRPGPYICAEWEFGGLPSWLLRDPDMKVRSSYEPYVEYVDEFFEKFAEQIVDLQFTKGDGPIIAFQVENEYGAFGVGDEPRDTEYLIHLKTKMEETGIEGLFFTSDTPSTYGQLGTIPGVLQTANFKRNPEREFQLLDQFQPNKPNMVAEFWTGWFDHWMGPVHAHTTVEDYIKTLDAILSLNGSVNFFMFHGGTSFGFMNGANLLPIFPSYAPDVSSYDYDAPVSEAGDYTDKYWATRELLASYNTLPISHPEPPAESAKQAYGSVKCDQYLNLEDLIQQLPEEMIVTSPEVISMEDLPINGDNGQSYGYILYRHKRGLSDENHIIQIVGHVRDYAVFIVDGQRKTEAFRSILQLPGFGYWPLANRSMSFNATAEAEESTIDLLVENLGRNNFGPPSYFDQKRGLPEGPVLIDDEVVSNWTIYPLEFRGDWVRSLNGWKDGKPTTQIPSAYKGILRIDEEPADTFILTKAWGKGVVFVNGFNIGRYHSIGPLHSLYIPAPLLRKGENSIVVFDLFEHVEEIVFSDEPDLGPLLQDLLPTQRTDEPTLSTVASTSMTTQSTKSSESTSTAMASTEMTTEIISTSTATTKPTGGSTEGTTSSSPAHFSSILITACTLVALFSNY